MFTTPIVLLLLLLTIRTVFSGQRFYIHVLLVQKQPAPDRAAQRTTRKETHGRVTAHTALVGVCPVCPLLVCPGLHQYLFSKQGVGRSRRCHTRCVPCVSRLPPVSFYRKIAKHGGATSVSQSPLVCHHGGEPLSFAWVV